MGKLRVGEGHPRDRIVVDADRQAKQRAPDHQASVIIGSMGELCAARDIADGIDTTVGRSQALVHDDPLRADRDTGGGKIEPLQVWPSAGRDQEMAARDCLLATRPAEDDMQPRLRLLHADDRNAAAH